MWFCMRGCSSVLEDVILTPLQSTRYCARFALLECFRATVVLSSEKLSCANWSPKRRQNDVHGLNLQHSSQQLHFHCPKRLAVLSATRFQKLRFCNGESDSVLENTGFQLRKSLWQGIQFCTRECDSELEITNIFKRIHDFVLASPILY